MRTLTIKGDLTDDEVCEFLATVRRIDLDTSRTLHIRLDDPTAELDAMERLMRRGLPPVPDRETSIEVHRRKH